MNNDIFAVREALCFSVKQTKAWRLLEISWWSDIEISIHSGIILRLLRYAENGVRAPVRKAQTTPLEAI